MSSPTSSVRVRMAPSPTGYLHVGNARTAVFNWLFARHSGGTFILRVEDTDRSRFVPGAIEVMLDTLRWLGLDYDEGPEIGGPFGPYVQSERLPLYQEHAERLIGSGHAYRCYCTEERLAAVREEQQRNRQPTGYDRHCRTLTSEQQREREASGLPSVVRFAVPLEGATSFTDMVRGEVTYRNEQLNDFVMLKSDGFPTYHLAVVVDDHLMEISHIIRADEWISSTGNHILLYDAFGWTPPLYAHGSTILAPDRSRLSKRHGATAVLEFRDMGIVPEALLNYLALLGAAYSGDREVYSATELVEVFDIPRLHATPAIFDRQKLEWMNGHYINHILSMEDVTERCLPHLLEAGLVTDETPPAYLQGVIALVKERLKLLPEVVELTDFFFREPEPGAEELTGKKKLSPEEAGVALSRAEAVLSEVESWDDVATESEMEQRLRALGADLGLKTGPFFMTLRVAITGREQSPGLTETMRVLGKERTLDRLRRAADALRQPSATAS